jgi:hypothetical protein
MGPRAGLDVMEKRQILPLPGIEPRQSSPHNVSIPSYRGSLLRDVVLHMKITSETSDVHNMNKNNERLIVCSIKSDGIYSSVK